MTGEFDGRRVLVTGASKGIGHAVTARLRQGGATVLTTARSAPSDLVDAGLFIAADITTADGCAAVAEAVRHRLGRMVMSIPKIGTHGRH